MESVHKLRSTQRASVERLFNRSSSRQAIRPVLAEHPSKLNSTARLPVQREIKLQDLLNRAASQKHVLRKQISQPKRRGQLIEPENDTAIPSTVEYYSYGNSERCSASRAQELKVSAFLRSTWQLKTSVALVPSKLQRRMPSVVLVCDGDEVRAFDIK